MIPHCPIDDSLCHQYRMIAYNVRDLRIPTPCNPHTLLENGNMYSDYGAYPDTRPAMNKHSIADSNIQTRDISGISLSAHIRDMVPFPPYPKRHRGDYDP
jgi:hypothetical protein